MSMTLSGALQGLQALHRNDFPWYKNAVAAGGQMGWAYYFPYLLAKDKPGKGAVLVGEEDGSKCLFQWKAGRRGGRLDLLFPPLPMQGRALVHALERANEFNGRRSARVLRIDAKDVDAVSAAGVLEVKQRRAQYLFAPADYQSLPGRKYRTLRRHIIEFEALPGVEVIPWTPGHLPACRELLRRWRKEHRAALGTSGGAGATRRFLRLAGKLPAPDVTGELVFVEGRLTAFAFGGEIRPGLACFFDAKSDASVPGVSYAHRRSYLLSLRAFERVNDGSDAGRPGLRQLKDSFRPVAMHPEYRAGPKR